MQIQFLFVVEKMKIPLDDVLVSKQIFEQL